MAGHGLDKKGAAGNLESGESTPEEGSSRLRTMEEGAVSRLGFEDFKGWGRCSRTHGTPRYQGTGSV